MTPRKEYVDRLCGWLTRDDKELAEAVGDKSGLDGVYRGTSKRIVWLLRVAYHRGVRRGCGLAWEAKQPIGFREAKP